MFANQPSLFLALQKPPFESGIIKQLWAPAKGPEAASQGAE